MTLTSTKLCPKWEVKIVFQNVLLVIKHMKWAVFVSAVALQSARTKTQLVLSGSFPSLFSCNFSLSGMLMGNVILFLFAAGLLFWFCLSGMENSTSLRVGVLCTGHLAVAHIFLMLITWWQGNLKDTSFQLNFSFHFNNSEKKEKQS